MTKLGTPIGAGPKGAIVVVGLARVGAPPTSNWAPPSPSSPSGWVPPPVALGAATAPPLLPPPLESPRSSLWVTPPRTSGVGSSSSDSPRANSLWDFLPVAVPVPDSFSFSVDPKVEVEGEGEAVSPPVDGVEVEGFASGASVLSLGEEQSGSSMSIRPSPSLSIPSEHCGARGVVVAGVVEVAGGVVGVVPDPVGADPAEELLDPFGSCTKASVAEPRGEAAGAEPTAASARKAASARINASLLLMRLISRCHGRPRPRPSPLPAGSSVTLPTRPDMGNGNPRPQYGLNDRRPHAASGRFPCVPDVLVKLASTNCEDRIERES